MNKYDAITTENGVDEIPIKLIEYAARQAYRRDREMAVGLHPQFGWVCRDPDDGDEIAKLSNIHMCDASGIVE